MGILESVGPETQTVVESRTKNPEDPRSILYSHRTAVQHRAPGVPAPSTRFADRAEALDEAEPEYGSPYLRAQPYLPTYSSIPGVPPASI